MYESITCPHCKETWTYKSTNPKQSLTKEDEDWLDKHYDNCPRR